MEITLTSRGRKLALCVAVVLVAGGVLLLLPGTALPVGVPGADKLAHFGLFSLLGLEVMLASALRRDALPTARHYLVAIALVVALGAASEAAQAWVPGRTADAADLAADALGGAAGALAFRLAAFRLARCGAPT